MPEYRKIKIYEAPATHRVFLNGILPYFVPGALNARSYLSTEANTQYFDYEYVEYPAAAFPINVSVDIGANNVLARINANPGRFVLFGQSQGAQVMTEVYRRLPAARRADCLLVVNMVNPLRQAGRSYPGGQVVPGHGVAPASIRMTNTPDLMWEFANTGDSISACLDNAQGVNFTTLYSFAYSNYQNALGQLGTALTSFQDFWNGMFGTSSPHFQAAAPTWVPPGDTVTAKSRILNHLNNVLGPAHVTDYPIGVNMPGLIKTDGTEKTALSTVRGWNDGVNRHTLFTACGTQQDGWGFYNDPGTQAARTALLGLVNAILTEGGEPTLTSLPPDGANGADLGVASPDTIVGYRVNPNLYNWVPVSYPASFPGAAANLDNSWQPSNISFADSVTLGSNAMISLIQATPGTFALCGMSQGSMVISNVLKAMQPGGVLAHRYNDCIGAVAFGNPMRRQGTGLPGIASTTGAGMFSSPNPVGAISGLANVAVPDWWWEMNCPGDLFSDAPMSAASGAAGAILNKIASSFVVVKNTDSGNPINFGLKMVAALGSGAGTLFNAARSQKDVAGLRALGLWLRDQGMFGSVAYGFANMPVLSALALGVVRNLFKLTPAETTPQLLAGNYPRGNPHMFYGIKKPGRPTGLATWNTNYSYIDIAVSYLNQRAGAVPPRAARTRRS